ncbi:hypothetical protein [Actinacidiphila paucisporea]|uniref:Uncharacterized protein n=1 Tax=Actinacidiphila paucisporea TaxID=310782 RepID=A0A1M7MEM7_9ACTN|nr:hypothetical protein [Actinacidiphila paucisporea]SHM89299.1 hypothetical protein SAMN05216499_11611 [Actinacidiphila paucisporea]
MAQKSPVSPTLAAGIAVSYHVLALMKDAESWRAGELSKQFRAQPDSANFVRLVPAEGVFIQELGFLL